MIKETMKPIAFELPIDNPISIIGSRGQTLKIDVFKNTIEFSVIGSRRAMVVKESIKALLTFFNENKDKLFYKSAIERHIANWFETITKTAITGVNGKGKRIDSYKEMIKFTIQRIESEAELETIRQKLINKETFLHEVYDNLDRQGLSNYYNPRRDLEERVMNEAESESEEIEYDTKQDHKTSHSIVIKGNRVVKITYDGELTTKDVEMISTYLHYLNDQQ